MPKSEYLCEICDKKFNNKSNVRRHLRSFHQIGIEEKVLKCHKCDYTTCRTDNLERHKKTLHAKPVDDNNLKSLCPGCDFKCQTRYEILEHFEKQHAVIFDYQILEFQNMQDFEFWKADLEKNEHVSFCNKYSFVTEDGHKKVHFSCSRDGFYKSKASKRHEKILGTNKINGCCPATIDIDIFDDDQVRAYFQRTHFGHKNEVGRMRLLKTERDEIARKISLKIPFEDILDSIRESINVQERKNLVSRKDLHNIARDYNLLKSIVRDSNDFVSVTSWIQDMQKKRWSNLVLQSTRGTLQPFS